MGKGLGQGRTTGGMGMWFTSPRALHAAHVSLLTTSAAKAPAPCAVAWYQAKGCAINAMVLVCPSLVRLDGQYCEYILDRTRASGTEVVCPMHCSAHRCAQIH